MYARCLLNDLMLCLRRLFNMSVSFSEVISNRFIKETHIRCLFVISFNRRNKIFFAANQYQTNKSNMTDQSVIGHLWAVSDPHFNFKISKFQFGGSVEELFNS